LGPPLGHLIKPPYLRQNNIPTALHR